MEIYKRKLNHETMQQILDSFVELTGIRAAYFGNNDETVTGMNKPQCEFCQLVKQISLLDANCRCDDNAAFKTAEKTGKPHLYKCHMGLYEAAIPIYIKNNIMGFLMLGQILSIEDSDSQISTIVEKLRTFNLSLEQISEFRNAYNNMTSMSMPKIKAAVNMLNIIVQHIVNTDVIYVYDLDSIEKAKHYIGQNLTKHLSLGDIAEFSGLSPSYLSFLFRRETGFTITHYIDKLRLDQAKDLLVLTSKSIKEVSSLVGFEDQNYFSRIFKKREGMSPLDYRIKTKKSC